MKTSSTFCVKKYVQKFWRTTFSTHGCMESYNHQGGKINVGLRLFDRQDLSYNKNGIYKGIVRLNGVLQFEFKMDQLSFNDSNYINLLIYYEEYDQKRRRIQRFALHPELQVSFLDST